VSQSDTSLQTLAINTVRTLSMDAVQAAESGHPGTPMALAPLAYALYTRHVRHNPADPHWPDRDRVVLSAGHASMLLYSTLYLSGYDLSLDELKNFRQWGSKTPGHPEFGHTAGVETTTGPLGQGVGNAIGFAVAEAHLAATFNRETHGVIDHYTWFIAGDGCLQEGISHEVASFAGHQKLGKIIGFWDDNSITIDGRTDLSSSDDVAKRFESYGWQVLHISNVNDQSQIDAVIADAKADTTRPTLVCTKTIIGFGSPNRANTAKAHGEPLGKDEITLTKAAYGWPSDEPFHVPTAALEHWRLAKERGVNMQAEWMRRFAEYSKAFPSEAKELGRRWHGDLPVQWEKALPAFTAENGTVASRAASGTVINAIGPAIPELIGGSADLTGSNLTNVKNGGVFSATQRNGRNFHFGIREHGMGAVNGMALHGGIIPYGGTFLVFADYMRPAIRLAALMRQQVIYVFTHDSIGLGEDGPTHQPVEHLSSLRCIPNLLVLRPADAAETAEAWRAALKHRTGPSALVLTRQKLALVDRSTHAAASGVAQGAYVLKDAPEGHAPTTVIIATGSEVEIALKAQSELAAKGVATRVVSMPSMELFAQQPKEYQTRVLPEGIRRVAIEAAHPMSWHRWVGADGVIIGIDGFGASAPAPKLYQEYGITAEAVVAAVTAR
jgi:transketolase